MLWFKPSIKKHPQELTLPQVCFLDEQDGPIELKFKAKLISFFQRDKSVQMAYLVRVYYGDKKNGGVALCLKTQFGPDKGMAAKIGMIFASLFGAHEHLDIIFLDNEQETRIIKVCKPFFEQC